MKKLYYFTLCFVFAVEAFAGSDADNYSQAFGMYIGAREDVVQSGLFCKKHVQGNIEVIDYLMFKWHHDEQDLDWYFNLNRYSAKGKKKEVIDSLVRVSSVNSKNELNSMPTNRIEGFCSAYFSGIQRGDMALSVNHPRAFKYLNDRILAKPFDKPEVKMNDYRTGCIKGFLRKNEEYLVSESYCTCYTDSLFSNLTKKHFVEMEYHISKGGVGNELDFVAALLPDVTLCAQDKIDLYIK